VIATTSPRKIILAAKDQSLIDNLDRDNGDGYSINACDSVVSLQQQPQLLAGCAMVIADIDDGDDEFAEGLERLRKLEPGLLFIVIGEGSRLKSALTPQLQGLSYRVFSKPINSKQILLAFGYDESPATVAAEEDVAAPLAWAKPALGLAVMASLLAVIGWGANGGFQAGTTAPMSAATQLSEPALSAAPATTVSVPTTTDQLASTATEKNSALQRNTIDELNDLAVLAQRQQRLTIPAGDNALYYYNSVLALDPFNTTAFLGRKKIVEQLRQLYIDRALAGAFDRALEVIVQLKELAPKTLQQYKLREGLQHAIHLQRLKLQDQGSDQQLASLLAMLTTMVVSFPELQSELSALQLEQNFKTKIDSALVQGRLLPPQQDSAFTLIMAARGSNSVAVVGLQRRVKALAEAFVDSAIQQTMRGEFVAARALLAPLRQLAGDSQQLAQLHDYIKRQQQQHLQEELLLQQARAELAKAASPVITPASIITRGQPRYPERARRKNIEGWVRLRFDLDSDGQPGNIEVLAAKPKGIFDSAARNAVISWRYSPAINSVTGRPVATEKMESKVVFALKE